MIPQELVDSIICEVGNNEDIVERKSTLQACSLTSWSFLEPSRRILFQEIDLHEDSGEEEDDQIRLRSKLERFLDVLQHNPSLGMMVKSLVIRLSTTRLLINRQFDTLRRENAESAILPSVIDFLTHVQSFHLTFDFENQGHCWTYVDTPLQEALFGFCGSRPITQLKLSFLQSFPISLITKCSQLTSLLVLGEVYFANCTTPNTAETTIHNLKSLTINQPASSIVPQDWIEKCQCTVPHFDLSNLQSLEISAQMLRTHAFNAPSVKYLRVTGNYYGFASSFGLDERLEYIENPVSLNEWHSLEVLEFMWLFATSSHGLGLGVLPLINPIRFGNYTSVAQRISIDTLIINTVWYCCTRRNEMDRFIASAGWNDIDGILTSSTFPNLRAIKLKFTLKYYQTSTAAPLIRNYLLDRVEKKLPELLPSISASNQIKVDLDIIVQITGQRLENND